MKKYNSPIVQALWFAYRAHKGQVRKYTGEPYWNHCRDVANAVQEAGAPDEAVCAAWLHDTLEDTQTNFGDLHEKFGIEVAMLVWELTDVYTHAGYPAFCRATRKRWECSRLADISPMAKLIKRADIADNTKSIVKYDPKFSIVYLREKADMLEVLT